MPSEARPRRLARPLAWLISLLLAPLLILFLLEAGLRVAGFGWPTAFFLDSPLDPELTTNRQFGWRYFPRRIARTPLPFQVDPAKPAGVYRIVVLGESAAMGFPDPMFSFAHQLQAMHKGPVEVINASMTAISSQAVREIAAECMRLHPDLIVIYMGNNEVVGPGGIAPTLRRLRLGQLLVRQQDDLRQWRGMEMFLGRQLPFGDPRLESIYANFRDNLNTIVQGALAAKASVVLSTIAVNLKDSPPFAGDAANSAFAARDFAKARDLDTLRFRADSRINAIIREVAAATPGVKLLDAEKLIAPDSTAFYEHVHLRPAANIELAAAIDPAATAPPFIATAWDEYRMLRDIAGLMSRPPFHGNSAVLAELAALRTKVDLDRAIDAYAQRSSRFPNDLLIRERYAELLAEAGQFDRAANHWGKLTRAIPGIPNWHTGLAESLLPLGRLDEAKKSYQEALHIDNQFLAAHIGLGAIEFSQGHLLDAEVHFRDALKLDPDSPEANNDLAGLFVRQNRLADALPLFSKAVRIRPEFANAQYSYAATLARLGRKAEAITHYRAALAANPDFASAHYDLGLLLAGESKFDEAISHYTEALRLDPFNADAHNNWGTALARQGRMKEAIAHFEEALRIRPNHAAARRNLELAHPSR